THRAQFAGGEQSVLAGGAQERVGAGGDGALAGERLRQGLAGGDDREPCRADSARRSTRARATQAELLQHSWNEPVGTGASLPIRPPRTIPIAARPRPSRHAALPHARGDRICHVGAEHALGGALRGWRARLFPRAQRAGGIAEIPFAAGARAARARGRTAGAPGGAAQTYLIRSRMLT